MKVIKYKKGKQFINPRAILYLAYGSNLFTEQMNQRCPSNFIIGKYNLQGYKLTFKRIFKGYFATIEKDENSYVPSLLYAISRKDKKTLDEYEAVGEQYGNHYYASYLNNCLVGDVKYDNVLVYIMSDTNLYGLPDDSYIYKLKKGYEKFEFDTGILQKAINDVYQKEKQSIPVKYDSCKNILENDINLVLTNENIASNKQ